MAAYILPSQTRWDYIGYVVIIVVTIAIKSQLQLQWLLSFPKRAKSKISTHIQQGLYTTPQRLDRAKVSYYLLKDGLPNMLRRRTAKCSQNVQNYMFKLLTINVRALPKRSRKLYTPDSHLSWVLSLMKSGCLSNIRLCISSVPLSI